MTSTHARRRLLAAALTAFAAFSTPAFAATCLRSEEASAFSLRHLQSRLMVAALSCNQRDAYNAFMTRFQPELSDGGRNLITYFDRNGGKTALNSYITEIANAAGLDRASDPRGFCEQTWDVFMSLQEAPENLSMIAQSNVMYATATPPTCQPDTPLVAAAKMKAAATRKRVAADK
jgi:hypothetical protein